MSTSFIFGVERGTEFMSLVAGKNIVVMGVANDRSIAWAIAQSLAAQGANLVFTYENERVEERVRKLADTIPNAVIMPCNVTVDEDIDRLAESLRGQFGVLHGIVHSIAFAKTEELEGLFVGTSREGFALAHDISAYSLVAVAQRLHPLMTEGGSIMTMTYLGAERAMKNYNVMGVAKAALEAAYVIWPTTSASSTFASMRFPPDRFGRWQRRALRISIPSCVPSRRKLRCAVRPMWRKSEIPRCS